MKDKLSIEEARYGFKMDNIVREIVELTEAVESFEVLLSNKNLLLKQRRAAKQPIAEWKAKLSKAWVSVRCRPLALRQLAQVAEWKERLNTKNSSTSARRPIDYAILVRLRMFNADKSAGFQHVLYYEELREFVEAYAPNTTATTFSKAIKKYGVTGLVKKKPGRHRL
jgi:hypothetical protein